MQRESNDDNNEKSKYYDSNDEWGSDSDDGDEDFWGAPSNAPTPTPAPTLEPALTPAPALVPPSQDTPQLTTALADNSHRYNLVQEADHNGIIIWPPYFPQK